MLQTPSREGELDRSFEAGCGSSFTPERFVGSVELDVRSDAPADPSLP